MFNLTPTQQKALQVYKDTGELGKSLENILIEHLFEELANCIEARKRFESLGILKIQYVDFMTTNIEKIGFGVPGIGYDFNCCPDSLKISFLLNLLSRTPPTPEHPQGQAVIPFLDVKTRQFKNRYKKYILNPSFVFESASELINETPQTLDHLLYHEFTEALRVCKGFEEAYKIINLIYIQNIYV